MLRDPVLTNKGRESWGDEVDLKAKASSSLIRCLTLAWRLSTLPVCPGKWASTLGEFGESEAKALWGDGVRVFGDLPPKVANAASGSDPTGLTGKGPESWDGGRIFIGERGVSVFGDPG